MVVIVYNLSLYIPPDIIRELTIQSKLTGVRKHMSFSVYYGRGSMSHLIDKYIKPHIDEFDYYSLMENNIELLPSYDLGTLISYIEKYEYSIISPSRVRLNDDSLNKSCLIDVNEDHYPHHILTTNYIEFCNYVMSKEQMIKYTTFVEDSQVEYLLHEKGFKMGIVTQQKFRLEQPKQSDDKKDFKKYVIRTILLK